MKFTIAPEVLENLMKQAGVARPKKSDAFTLSACAGRVSVEFKGVTAGIVAPISAEGAVKLPAKNFRAMLDTYKGTPVLTFEGGPEYLKIENFKMPVLAWNPRPAPDV